jgi:hypothetical protein
LVVGAALVAVEVAVDDVTVAEGVGLALEHADGTPEFDAIEVAVADVTVAEGVGLALERVHDALELGLKKLAALEFAAAADLEAGAVDRGAAARGAPAGTWPGTGVSGRPSRRIWPRSFQMFWTALRATDGKSALTWSSSALKVSNTSVLTRLCHT